MSTFESASIAVNHLAHALDTGRTDADYMLRRRMVRIGYDLQNEASRLQIMRAEKACVVKAGRVTTDDTIAAGANSLSLRMKKHDGAGGAQTNVSALIDGTAVALTGDQFRSFTLNTDTSVNLAAGDCLEVEVTVNGMGAAGDMTMFEVEYEYV